MYPPPPSSSASSSSSHPQSSNIVQTGLTRYGSAPGSLLTSTVDALIGGGGGGGGGSRLLPGGGHHYFSSGDSTTCKDHRSSSPSPSPSSYDADAAASFGGSALLRQKSSPAGFLTHLAATSTHNHNGGFTITRAGGSRLKSELSFTGGHGQECLSGISDNNASAVPPPTHTESPFGMHSWGDNSSASIVFSAHPPKRSKTTTDSDILHCLTALDSQFSLPQTTLEMATVEKLLHIPEDSVPCKIRAKRGCATHPRSIAERERRTRISGKLKKLQDLVPNMDKQTSYADMLDLAVQHIKGLQSQVQTLHNELENCTCGCKQST